MKKFLIVVILFLSMKANAQAVDSLRLKLDDIFLYIDKSQIPNGYLAEYGAEFSPLHFFNGMLTDSNVVGSLDNFRFIYTDVETAKIHSSAPSLLPLETVNTLIDSSKASGKSALVFLACNYASLKPSALTDGLFTWKRDRLYDVTGRTISPYANNLLFAAAATTSDFLNTVTLNYDPTIIFTNNSTTLQNVFVDFQNGAGFQLLNTAGISHTYTDSTGLKEIIVKAETTSGQFL